MILRERCFHSAVARQKRLDYETSFLFNEFRSLQIVRISHGQIKLAPFLAERDDQMAPGNRLRDDFENLLGDFFFGQINERNLQEIAGQRHELVFWYDFFGNQIFSQRLFLFLSFLFVSFEIPSGNDFSAEENFF